MNPYKADQKSAALRRVSHRQWVLKPQDFAAALKLVALKRRSVSYQTLAKMLWLSPYEAHAAVQRLVAARLAADLGSFPEPITAALRDFVLHGAPYCYPAVRGEPTIGFLTAHSVAPLKNRIRASKELSYVWPHPRGNARGTGLLPLYEDLPLAAQEDPAFHSLLSLFDALRVGQARERELAADYLKDLLS